MSDDNLLRNNCLKVPRRISTVHHMPIDEQQPVYIRLRDAIAEAILEGRYHDGDALPSVRAFAAANGANPLTVAKAYQTFQDDGLVIVRRGVGMFVADGASVRLLEQARQRFLEYEWPRFRSQMHRLGLSLQELVQADN